MSKHRSRWDLPSGEPLLQFDHLLRSRYSETDQMGIVYYGRYLEFFEVARTEMIRSLGISYATLEQRGVMLPVVEASVRYLTPLLYDEAFMVRVKVFEPPTVRLETYYEVFGENITTGGQVPAADSPSSSQARQSSRPSAIGYVSLAFMDRHTRRPTRAPGELLERIPTPAP